MNHLYRNMIIGLAFAVVLGIAIGLIALQRSSDARTHTDEITAAFKAKVAADQRDSVQGRISACQSSTALREKFRSEIVVILAGASATDLSLSQQKFVDDYVAITQKFIATNPNCDQLTPEQRRKALG